MTNLFRESQTGKDYPEPNDSLLGPTSLTFVLVFALLLIAGIAFLIWAVIHWPLWEPR